MAKKEVKDIDVEVFIENVKEKFNLSDKEILDLSKKEEDIVLPLNIFSKKLGMLEASSLYLHDKQKLKFSRIAKLLHRDYQTIWTSYNKAKKKIGRSS